MNKKEARRIVAAYWENGEEHVEMVDLMAVADAHIVLKIPQPEPLGSAIAKAWNGQLPDGYTAVVWADGRQMRYAAVKQKFVRRFVQMIENPNDTDDVS